MGFFAKRRQLLAQAIAEAVAQALSERSRTKPVEIADAGAKMLESMTGFLTGAGDLALRGAASALGQRGGKRTAERRRARLMPAKTADRPACPLCKDPQFRHVTVEMIVAHRQHEGVNARSDPDPANDQEPDHDQRVFPIGAQAVGFTPSLNGSADG